MGGYQNNKDEMHQAVMEHIAGVPAAKQAANPLLMRLFVTSAALGTVILLYASLTGGTNNRLAGVGFGLVIISLPWLALVQRFALHITLHRHNLRATNLFIGKRERDPSDVDFNKPDAELFAAAASQVCNVSFANDNAWEYHAEQTYAPGVAGIILVSSSNQRYLCLYGEVKAVLGMCGDLWDFGFTRPLASADRERFTETAKQWKKTSAFPVAMAYIPWSDDSETTNQNMSHATLLGLLNVQTTRGDREIVSVSPVRSLYLATIAQLSLSTSLLLFALLNITAALLFTTPFGFGVWQFLLLGWFVLSIPIATLNWDHSTVKTPKAYPLRHLLGSAFLVGIIGFGSYLAHLFSAGGIASSDITRTTLQTAAATALFTIGLCSLINLLLARSDGKHVSRHHVSNPLFLLGMLCAALVLLTAVVLTGPLTGLGLLITASSVVLYLGIRYVWIYANAHHTREHIIELLRTNN